MPMGADQFRTLYPEAPSALQDGRDIGEAGRRDDLNFTIGPGRCVSANRRCEEHPTGRIWPGGRPCIFSQRHHGRKSSTDAKPFVSGQAGVRNAPVIGPPRSMHVTVNHPGYHTYRLLNRSRIRSAFPSCDLSVSTPASVAGSLVMMLSTPRSIMANISAGSSTVHT